MKTLSAIVAGAIATLLILLLIRLRYDRSVKQIWRSLKTKPSGLVFTKDMVADLDEPVQRYFLHAIAPGTPLAAYVELEMSGGIRQKPDADWLPMQASQIVSESGGFVWQANVGKSLMQFSGADYYAQNHGRVKFSLWDLIPLVDAQSKDIDRSSIGRLCVEYVWLPSALLPHNGVAWQAIDQNKIQANFKIDNEPITLNLTIDRDGRLLNLSLPRWADATEDKTWQYIPFGGEIQAEQTFGGYTIPSKMDAGYWFGTDEYWAFFESTIERAKFY
ncbi:hypothetical protein IQ255_16375 [Pleurocapsales cyanobacterium LEGE 10410]|nr:hypothetical protein [Pleurocapsales cyanobacterium LEGE 10410]